MFYRIDFKLNLKANLRFSNLVGRTVVSPSDVNFWYPYVEKLAGSEESSCGSVGRAVNPGVATDNGSCPVGTCELFYLLIIKSDGRLVGDTPSACRRHDITNSDDKIE